MRSVKKIDMRIVCSVALAKVVLPILLPPFSATAQQTNHVTSEQVNRAIQEVEKLAQKEIPKNTVPGLAIAVVFQDKVVYAKGFGVRDVNSKTPVDADTVFQLASLSKSNGAISLSRQVREIHDDPI
jgi:CubicO group peptidase (beta-lactamase class C family)